MFLPLLILCLFIGSGLTGVCPPASEIKPCTCTNTTIECTTEKPFDLSQIMLTIAYDKEPRSEELSFETFILNNSKIETLKDTVFQGVTFNTIKLLDCHQLSCVSPVAFNDLERNLTKLIAINTSFNSTDKQCNIFEALKLLYNLETITIIESGITEIPAYAFDGKISPLTKLKKIDLSGGVGGLITSVGKEAFSTLQELELIDLSRHKINKVESFAFSFNRPSSSHLTIDLTHNNLDEHSFEVEAFEVNERVTKLNLSFNLKLKVLSETVFVPFLMNRENVTDDNQINLNGTPLSCTAKNVWLFKREASLHLLTKLKNIMADDGQDFFVHNESECSKHF